MKLRYQLYEDGKLYFEGTCEQIQELLGVSSSAINRAATSDYTLAKRFKVKYASNSTTKKIDVEYAWTVKDLKLYGNTVVARYKREITRRLKNDGYKFAITKYDGAKFKTEYGLVANLCRDWVITLVE